MSRWLVVGASPSARLWLPQASEDWHDQLVTTNAGIRLCLDHGLVPAWIWLSDSVACQRYGDDAAEARERGARLATARRAQSALISRRVADADLIVSVAEPVGQVPRHVPGQVSQARFSGLMAVELALLHGATALRLVGFDGYRSSEQGLVADSVDGSMGKAAGLNQTLSWIEPWLHSVAAMRPDVSVTVYGQPIWAVPAAWTVRAA